MLDGQVLGASQVEYKPFKKPPLKREVLCSVFALLRGAVCSCRCSSRSSLLRAAHYGSNVAPLLLQGDSLLSQQCLFFFSYEFPMGFLWVSYKIPIGSYRFP